LTLFDGYIYGHYLMDIFKTLFNGHTYGKFYLGNEF